MTPPSLVEPRSTQVRAIAARLEAATRPFSSVLTLLDYWFNQLSMKAIRPRESAHQACEHAIRRAVLDGELAPGARLPPERTLADTLGVSRLTLRSALAALTAQGILAVRQGSGYVVQDITRTGGGDLLADLASLASERGDLTAIAAELFRVRRHLAHAVLEHLVEHPPKFAAIKNFERAVEAMAHAAGLGAAAPASGTKPRASVAPLASGAQPRAVASVAPGAKPRAVASVAGLASGTKPRAVAPLAPGTKPRASVAPLASGAQPGAAASDVTPTSSAQPRAVAASLDLEAIAMADLDVVAALLDATSSPVLRLCINPVTAVVTNSPQLRAAIYADPASNVTGWRAVAVWLRKPARADLAVQLLAARDAATLERMKRTRR